MLLQFLYLPQNLDKLLSDNPASVSFLAPPIGLY